MTAPAPLSVGELLAVLAVLAAHLPAGHKLTARLQALYDHADRPAGNQPEGDSRA